MKVRIEVDVTPEEARAFLGLPDMTSIHEAFLGEAKSRIAQTAGLMDVEPIVRTWAGFGGLAQDAIGSLLSTAMRAATSSGSAPTSGTRKPAADDSGS